MTDFEGFVLKATKIINDMNYIKLDIRKAVGGNKIAARRARVGLVKLEKDGKIFRKLSIKYVDKAG